MIGKLWAVRLGSLLLCALMALGASGLAAAETSATDRAAAEALFDQALQLLEKNQADAACPKLEESQRLDPGIGTLLYLADCYRQVGRTASAWATFLEASYEAETRGQTDRQQVAAEQAAALKPQLSYLVLLVEQKEIPGLSVTNDEKEVGKALWDSQTPVDPGKHTIAAQAPGKQPFRGEVVVPPGPGVTEFRVPVLKTLATKPAAATADVAPKPALAVAPLPEREPTSSSQGTWGWVAVAAGGAALVGGGLFSVLAISDNGRADDHCRRDEPTLCADRGVDLGDNARSNAQLATILSGVGGALAVTGVVLILTAPDDSDVAVGASTEAHGTGGRLWLSGAF